LRMPAATRDGKQMLLIVETERAEPWVGLASLAQGAPRPRKLWSAPGLKDPAWVDSERYLVVSREGGEDVLHLASSKRGPLRVLHRAPDLARPSLARDQKRLVIAERRGESWRLVLLGLDPSTEPRVLVEGRTPAWHPLDDVIAYVQAVEGRDKVHWLSLADGLPRQLVKPNPFAHRDPTWSPCGGWIAFGSNEGWDEFAEGGESTTWNLMAVTWSLRYAKRTETQWWRLTTGSAAATRPSWDSYGLWFETDQFAEAQVFQARLGLSELWANPACPHAK